MTRRTPGRHRRPRRKPSPLLPAAVLAGAGGAVLAGAAMASPPPAAPAAGQVRLAAVQGLAESPDADDGAARTGAAVRAATGAVSAVRATGLSGTLSYAGLERLWISAGGAPGAAAVAACIAEHESGGNQYATGHAGEKGYWQIHPVHGALSTYNAYGNARAAVIISSDGTNWGPWTTAPACGA